MKEVDVCVFLSSSLHILPLFPPDPQETGSELSKTVATFIVQKILVDEGGLAYICQTADRFFAVNTILNNMVASLVFVPDSINKLRLLKHIVRCFERLTENTRSRDVLRQLLPESLRDRTFASCLRDDPGTSARLAKILESLDITPQPGTQGPPPQQQQQQQQ